MAAGGSATEDNTQDYKGPVALGRSLLTAEEFVMKLNPEPCSQPTPRHLPISDYSIVNYTTRALRRGKAVSARQVASR